MFINTNVFRLQKSEDALNEEFGRGRSAGEIRQGIDGGLGYFGFWIWIWIEGITIGLGDWAQ